MPIQIYPSMNPKLKVVQMTKAASFVLRIFRNLTAFLIRVCNMGLSKDVPTHMRQIKYQVTYRV